MVERTLAPRGVFLLPRSPDRLRYRREQLRTPFFLQRLGHRLSQPAVHVGLARNYATVLVQRAALAEVQRAARNIGHRSAGFFDQQRACRMVLYGQLRRRTQIFS